MATQMSNAATYLKQQKQDTVVVDFRGRVTGTQGHIMRPRADLDTTLDGSIVDLNLMWAVTQSQWSERYTGMAQYRLTCSQACGCILDTVQRG